MLIIKGTVDGERQRRTLNWRGEGGIRTRDTVSRIHTFQECAFSRSATPASRRSGGEREADNTCRRAGASALARPANGRQKHISANKSA